MRDPEAWDTVADLTEEEREALREDSKSGFWQQPKQLRVTVITLCLAAIVQYVPRRLQLHHYCCMSDSRSYIPERLLSI
jgi:hypothetical protein